MEYTFEALAGIYVLKWKDVNLSARIDRIKETTRNISAEVLIQKTDLEHPHVLHTRMNLTDAKDKNKIVKILFEKLEERCPEITEIIWGHIIEQICMRVIGAYREGEPTYNLSLLESELGKKPKFLLYPFLCSEEANLFYGKGEAGKSYLALLISILVKYPETVYFRGWECPKESNVLYLDYETSRDEMLERAYMLGRTFGIKPFIHYRRCHQPLSSDIEEIHRVVVDKNIDLVIVDSVRYACEGDLNESHVTGAFFRAVRSLNKTIMLISHTQKNAETKTPLGSGGWMDAPRNVFEIKNIYNTDENILTMGIFHRKANNMRHIKPIGMRFTFDDNTCKPELFNIKEEPDLYDNVSLKDRIIDVLKRGQMTESEIAEELGEKENSIQRILYRYRHSYFVKLETKNWGLKAKNDD